MKIISVKNVAYLLLGSYLMTSCISSQEAYDKSKLSGYVGTQTKDILAKNPPVANTSAVEKRIDEVEVKVNTVDANNKKAAEIVANLEKKLSEIETIEKEQIAEFERSNNAVVFFDVNSAKLSTSAMQELYRWKSSIDNSKTSQNYAVSVFASADKTGSAKTNDKLREKRAESVRDFLVNVLGVKESVSVTTNQPSFSKENDVDRRAVISVTVKD
jgi:outer membrane protein OmpA-like peptidoglycan-associated protein